MNRELKVGPKAKPKKPKRRVGVEVVVVTVKGNTKKINEPFSITSY